MADRNEITVQGRLGADPTRRIGANGASWVTFRVGSTPPGRDRETGEFKDGRTEWFTVKTWNELAENVALSLRRGNPVIVRGKVHVDTWTGPSGERWDHVIHADSVAVDIRGGTATYVKTVREQPAPPATEGITGPDGSRWEVQEEGDLGTGAGDRGEDADAADGEVADVEAPASDAEDHLSPAGFGGL